jgi:hypothetical protein
VAWLALLHQWMARGTTGNAGWLYIKYKASQSYDRKLQRQRCEKITSSLVHFENKNIFS